MGGEEILKALYHYTWLEHSNVSYTLIMFYTSQAIALLMSRVHGSEIPWPA